MTESHDLSERLIPNMTQMDAGVFRTHQYCKVALKTTTITTVLGLTLLLKATIPTAALLDILEDATAEAELLSNKLRP